MNYQPAKMNSDQIIQFLELIKADIINSLQASGSDTTGQTAKSLTIVEDNGEFQLQMPSYMQLLETGRPPTSSNPVAGNPPMIERIQQWCRDKGIPDKAAWAIKKSIDKKGFKGKPGILSEPLNDGNINLRLSPTLEDMTNELSELLLSLIE